MIEAPARTRVCVIAEELSGPEDEGGRNFARRLAEVLSEVAEVHAISVGADVPATRTFFNPELKDALRRFQPSLVIYLPPASITLFAVLRSRVLRSWASGARIAMVIHQPRRHMMLSRLFIRNAAPDVTFSQDAGLVGYVRSLGCNAALLPPAVDLERFSPVDDLERLRLRDLYGIERDAYVALHIGHLKPERNLGVLKDLTRFATVVMVAAASTGAEVELRRDLEAAGVRVVSDLLPRIEELYQLADCYVFPVRSDEGAIAMPLSVLEAMACDLPVVTAPFGALPETFPGLCYAVDDEGVVTAVRDRRGATGTRRMIEGYTWRALAEDLLSRAMR